MSSALRGGFVLYDSEFTAYGGEKALIWVFDNYRAAIKKEPFQIVIQAQTVLTVT